MLDPVARVWAGVEEPMSLVDAQGNASAPTPLLDRQLIPAARHELVDQLLALQHEELIASPIADLLEHPRADPMVTPILTLARRGSQEAANLDGPLLHTQVPVVLDGDCAQTQRPIRQDAVLEA